MIFARTLPVAPAAVLNISWCAILFTAHLFSFTKSLGGNNLQDAIIHFVGIKPVTLPDNKHKINRGTIYYACESTYTVRDAKDVLLPIVMSIPVLFMHDKH